MKQEIVLPDEVKEEISDEEEIEVKGHTRQRNILCVSLHPC